MLNRIVNESDVSEIQARSIQRAVPLEKNSVHFGEFDSFEKLLVSLGYLTTFFKREEILDSFFDEANDIVLFLQAKLPSQGDIDLKNMVFDYLTQEDQFAVAEVGFVFGSRDVRRAEKAANLYLEGKCKWIYLSGSRPIEDKDRNHEGQKFRQHILQNFNIPEGVVIADPNDNSHTMADNVRGFLNYLDDRQIKPDSLAVISTAHYLRRGFGIMEKYVQPGIKVYRSNSGPMDGVSRDDWFMNEIGIRLIAEEFIKIKLQQLTNWS